MTGAFESSTATIEIGLLRRARRTLRIGGLRQSVASFRDVVNGQWQFRKSRPPWTVRVRGRLRITAEGSLRVGQLARFDGRTLPVELHCFRGALLTVGSSTFINYGTNISANCSVEIGDRCDIGQLVLIMDNDYHSVSDHHQFGESAPVRIEDDVWIGAKATILKGVTIGIGSVIGAHAVVTRDIPPYSMAVGVPARVVRSVGGVR